MDHLIIGNSENRRVRLFQNALERIGHGPARVVAYTDLLSSRNSSGFQSIGNLDDQLIVRIDSPGENEDVTRELIARGAEDIDGSHEKIDADSARRMKPDHGRIRFLRQWYLGFRRVLAEIAESMPISKFYNAPDDICVMFDKVQCQRRLTNRGVPVARNLQSVSTFDALLAAMRDRMWKRVFIKPAHGSSASGVIAFFFDGDSMRAVTPIEIEINHGRRCLYNNLEMQVHTNRDDIEAVVNYLIGEKVQIEQWLPKARLDDVSFDLRIVVINGNAKHVVVRTSASPITNLHLGNRRGDLQKLQRLAGSNLDDAMQIAEQAAAAMIDSHCVGVDLLLQPGFHSPTVLELNAFGDLLPGVFVEGRDTYDEQVRSMLSL